MIGGMELYHRTMVKPSNVSLAVSLHLLGIKSKEEFDRPKQLLLFRNSMLEVHSLILLKETPKKHELKLIHTEELFCGVAAADAIVYQDESLRKDTLIISLTNGKYQLLEWKPHSSRLALLDQNLIFSDPLEVERGLCKPVVGTSFSPRSLSLCQQRGRARHDRIRTLGVPSLLQEDRLPGYKVGASSLLPEANTRQDIDLSPVGGC